MTQIALEAEARFGVLRVAMLHRVGRLGARRGPPFVVGQRRPTETQPSTGTEYLIDQLKARVPIWKREWTGDTSRWIVCDASHASESPPSELSIDDDPGSPEIGSPARAGAR